MAQFSQHFDLGSAITTMNPLDASPGILFATDNLTITSAQGVTTTQSVRANRSAVGQFYFEVTLNQGTEHLVVGLVNDRYNLSEPHGIGTDAPTIELPLGYTSVGYLPQSDFKPGQVLCNNQESSSSYVVNFGFTNGKPGDVIGIAVDTVLGGIYFTSTAMQTDGNDFNNVVGNQAVAMQGLGPGPYFACMSTRDPASSVTFNFGGRPFAFASMLQGFSSYDAVSQAYNVPLNVPGPANLQVPSIPAANGTTIPLSWTAVSGALSYNIQQYNPINSAGLASIGWDQVNVPTNVATLSIVHQQGTPPTLLFIRVQAVLSTGVSQWSMIRAEPGTLSGQYAVPTTAATVVSQNGSNLTFQFTPVPPDTVNGEAVILFYAPRNPANAFITTQLSGPVVGVSGMTRITPSGSLVFPPGVNSFTIGPLLANTEYSIFYLLTINGVVEPRQYSFDIVSLAGTNGYTGGLGQRLIPPGGEYITWAGQSNVYVPYPTTTQHFAFYYDPAFLDANVGPAICNTLLTQCETIWTTLNNWFTSFPQNNPGIRTSINPDGSLINVFLTALQSFGAAHLGCRNADIVCSANTQFALVGPTNQPTGQNDFNANHYAFHVAAELVEVFEPNLPAMPDCDQHVLGEAMSLAMAYDLVPAGWDTNYTVGRLPAMWMNLWFNHATGANSVVYTSGYENRADWVNTNPAGETSVQFAAIGCATVFLMYLRYQLGYTWNQITLKLLFSVPAFGTCRQLYNALNGGTDDPYPAFVALLNSKFTQPPADSSVLNPPAVAQNFMNPFPIRQTVTAMNRLDTSSGMQISADGLTVTSAPGTTTTQSARATFPATSSCYFEVTLNTGAESLVVGLVNDRYNLSEPKGIGTDATISYRAIGWTSVGYLPQSSFKPGQIWCNNQRMSGSYVINYGITNGKAGDTIGFLFDPTGTLYIYSTAMAADGRTANNMSGVNTLDIDFLGPGPFFAAVSTRDPGASVTFNFGSKPFVNPGNIGGTLTPYDSAADTTYVAPLSGVSAPANFYSPTPVPSTGDQLPLTWDAVTGATSYQVQWYDVVAANGNISVPWRSTTTTGTSISVPLTVKSTAPNIWYARVRAMTANGPGQWTLPLQIQPPVVSGSTVTYPLAVLDGSPLSASGTTLSMTANPTPVNASFEYLFPGYIPHTSANTFIDARLQGDIVTFGNMQFANFPGTTFVGNITVPPVWTLNSMSQNVDYRLYYLLHGTAFEPGQYFFDFVSLPATSPYTQIGDRLLPSGCEAISWGGVGYSIYKPYAATQHFALYYEPGYIADATGQTICSQLTSIVEGAYAQAKTWFGGDSNHDPCIRTSINPTGSLINVFLTGPDQGFGAAHLTCRNADIVCAAFTSVVADPNQVGGEMAGTDNDINTTHYAFAMMAELVEVFMPNLQSLPDCDQHALGEGMSLAMAYDYLSAGWVTNYTAARLPAEWMNQPHNPTTGAEDHTAAGVFRPDFVNVNFAGETVTQFGPIGCAAIFFMYLVHQLNFSWTQICTALNQLSAFATLRQLHNKLTNTSVDPFPAFYNLILAHYPLPVRQQDGTLNNQVPDNFMNPFPLT